MKMRGVTSLFPLPLSRRVSHQPGEHAEEERVPHQVHPSTSQNWVQTGTAKIVRTGVDAVVLYADRRNGEIERQTGGGGN
jgi:hypothetical protein